MSGQSTLFVPEVSPRAGDDLERFAVISRCGRYRTSLMRAWVESPHDFVLFVGLNPSTADGMTDDPTIRRCIRFARDWGFDGLWMGNLYAYRATDPGKLPVGREAIGEQNDSWLRRMRAQSSMCVAAWGAHDMAVPSRTREVLALLGDVQVLGLSKGGHPRHPLYMRADTRPTPWTPKEVVADVA